MSTPAEILLVRALSHLERASLELQAGKVSDAADFMEKGIALVREVVER